MGAAILAAKACLSAGAGLLTSYFPSCGYNIMQTSIPEAMAIADENEFHLTTFPVNLDIYQAAGLGPGIGTDRDTVNMVSNFIKTFQRPLVLDADAIRSLYCISPTSCTDGKPLSSRARSSSCVCSSSTARTVSPREFTCGRSPYPNESRALTNLIRSLSRVAGKRRARAGPRRRRSPPPRPRWRVRASKPRRGSARSAPRSCRYRSRVDS